MLTIALAKGRTTDDLCPLWIGAGLPLPAEMDESRALVFDVLDDTYGELRFLLAKPADVPTYVAYGVADLGIVGKDVLLESGRDVYELLNLEVAQCQLCFAGLPSQQGLRPQRVATKYPRLADEYFRAKGMAVEVVPLSGSIELASVIGLTDRIFDLVQTGATLAANGLIVYERVHDVSARLVANRSSYRLKRMQISAIVSALAQQLKGTAGSNKELRLSRGRELGE